MASGKYNWKEHFKKSNIKNEKYQLEGPSDLEFTHHFVEYYYKGFHL